MIDQDGFRQNVAMVICNDHGKVLWAKRINTGSWQFPQGGIQSNETSIEAMYRELYEEVGITKDLVKIVAVTSNWHNYEIPKFYRKKHNTRFVGQRQKWFLLHYTGLDVNISLDHNNSPEFEIWKWINYWQAPKEIIDFKRQIYSDALKELEPFHRQYFA